MKFLFFLCVLCILFQFTDTKKIQFVNLPMEDGVHLHTEVVFPKNVQDTMSAVLVRSPYGYFDLEKYADLYSLFGFVCVTQDWRGTGKSEGHFSLFQQEGQDGKKTLEWIQEQTWSNGKVFTFGASADGMASILLAKENVSLAGQFILVSTGIGYEMFYPGGVYRNGLIEKWLRDTLREDDVENALETIRNHTTYDEWWRQIDMRDAYSSVQYPTTFYAGWYDIFTMGSIVTFEGYQKQSGMPNKHYIVIDPCGHCQDAAAYFPNNLIKGRTWIELTLNLYQFGVLEQLPRNIQPITFYVMSHNDTKEGDVGNFFVSVKEWPQYTNTQFFLENHQLSLKKSKVETYQTIFHNPHKPCPTIGGNNYEIPCGPLNQSVLFERDDVVVFTTEPLSEPFFITGPVSVQVKVKSNTSSFHVNARLSDYYKYESRLIMDGIQQMNGTEGLIQLWNTSYVFNQGHQIQLIIAGSNYPRFNVSKDFAKIEISSESFVMLPKIENTFFQE